MKRIIALLPIMLILTATSQNTFQKTYGGVNSEFGFSVQQTIDNGFILTGITMSFGVGNNDIYLIKTNVHGDTLWTKTYGGESDDRSYSIQQTTDSGYIITGYTSSFGAGNKDVYLIKTDLTGDTLWTKTFGGLLDDWGNSVQQTSDGGYIILGSTESFGSGNFDFYLIKTDLDGNTVWTKTYGGVNWDYGSDIQEINDNGFIMTGHSNSFGTGNYDVYLIKSDNNGDTLWTKTYGGTNDEYSYSVKQTNDGGFIITGKIGIYETSHFDVYLIKTNTNGDTVWTRNFGGEGYDVGSSVVQTTDGSFIIIGQTSSYGAGGNDIYLIKTESYGDTVWTKTFGGADSERGFSIQETQDNGYIMCGVTASFGIGINDVYLIKTDINGVTSPLSIQNFQHPNLDFVIYPNPASSVINIDFKTNPTDVYNIDIYSAFGQIIKKRKTDKNKTIIDISDLNEGIYFIVITNRQNRQWTKKIIKTHHNNVYKK